MRLVEGKPGSKKPGLGRNHAACVDGSVHSPITEAQNLSTRQGRTGPTAPKAGSALSQPSQNQFLGVCANIPIRCYIQHQS